MIDGVVLADGDMAGGMRKVLLLILSAMLLVFVDGRIEGPVDHDGTSLSAVASYLTNTIW